MHIYRFSIGQPAERSIYFISPDDIGKYTGPLLAETNFPVGSGFTRNISHLNTFHGADIIIDALQAQSWQPTYTFSVPPSLLSHPALPEGTDLANTTWSKAEVPPDFLLLLEAVAVRQRTLASPRRANRGRTVLHMLGCGLLLLVVAMSLTHA